MDLVPDGVAVEEGVVRGPEAPRALEGRLQGSHVALPQGDVELPGRLEIAIDAARLEKAPHLRHVLAPNLDEATRLVAAEVGDGQLVAVVYAFGEDPCVAAAGARRRPALLDDRDADPGLESQEMKGRPEPGEARADDDHVGIPSPLEGRRERTRGPGEPVAGLLDRKAL